MEGIKKLTIFSLFCFLLISCINESAQVTNVSRVNTQFRQNHDQTCPDVEQPVCARLAVKHLGESCADDDQTCIDKDYSFVKVTLKNDCVAHQNSALILHRGVCKDENQCILGGDELDNHNCSSDNLSYLTYSETGCRDQAACRTGLCPSYTAPTELTDCPQGKNLQIHLDSQKCNTLFTCVKSLCDSARPLVKPLCSSSSPSSSASLYQASYDSQHCLSELSCL